MEVAEEYRLCADTLYQTVNYLDRYLSLQPVQRSQLQLVGVTCMWIASKYEEVGAAPWRHFGGHSGWRPSQQRLEFCRLS